MWNDQPTKEKAAGSIYAHSKGVFHFDDDQGKTMSARYANIKKMENEY